MSCKKGKRESLKAIDVLKDLWLTTLLPRDRKLKEFVSRPFQLLADTTSSQLKRDRELLLWYVEGRVKACYHSYLSTLQSLLRDPVADVRSKLLGMATQAHTHFLYPVHTYIVRVLVLLQSNPTPPSAVLVPSPSLA